MAAYGESVGGDALLSIKLLTEQGKDAKVHRFVKVESGLTVLTSSTGRLTWSTTWPSASSRSRRC